MYSYPKRGRPQSPIAFAMSRRKNFRGALRGLGADAIPTSATPNPPGLQAPPNPLLVQPATSSNPLDFVSPQSAIAAGLDQNTVTKAWTTYVNSFASVQAAINGGIAPAIATEFWNGGAPPAVVPWWKRNLPLLIAGGGFVILAIAGEKDAR